MLSTGPRIYTLLQNAIQSCMVSARSISSAHVRDRAAGWDLICGLMGHPRSKSPYQEHTLAFYTKERTTRWDELGGCGCHLRSVKHNSEHCMSTPDGS